MIIYDLRHGARSLIKRPLFTAVAVLSLALGIGVNTSIFTFVRALLLTPLPVEQPEELVMVYTTTESSLSYFLTSYLNYQDFQEGVEDLDGLAASLRTPVNLLVDDEPEQVQGELVTGNYFPLLGIETAAGNTFGEETDRTLGGSPVVVISHNLWQRRFGSDPEVVGRDLTLNGQPFRVIGVAGRGFGGLSTLRPSDLWVPVSMREQVLAGTTTGALFDLRRGLILSVVGRLAPGATVEGVEQGMRTVASRLAIEYPDDNEGRSISVIPLGQAALGPNSRDGYVNTGKFLTAIVLLVLLIACANVANLLLTRSLAMQRDTAIQLSLGAGRWRLVRKFLIESMMLAILGGAVGLFFAIWMRDLLWSFKPPRVPDSLDISLDPQVIAFAFGLAVLSGLLFGLVPAIRATRPDLVTALKGEAGVIPERSNRKGLSLRKLLVVGQIALALVALLGAGLFLRSIQEAMSQDLGFDTENLMLATMNLGAQNYDLNESLDFYHRALERVEALPQVESAAMATDVMLSGTGLLRTFFITDSDAPGVAENGVLIQSSSVSVGYFDTMGLDLLRGRAFTRADRADSPLVVMINETMAERFWPGESPVGKRIGVFGVEQDVEIIGVIRDTTYNLMGEDATNYVYFSMEQATFPEATLHVRTTGDPQALTVPLTNTVRTLDRALPLVDVQPMTEVIEEALWVPRTSAALLTLFGILAAILASVGIYGVMAYTVSQRWRELGIRMALGAGRGRVRGLVIREGMLLVMGGLVLGVLVALAGGRYVESLLYGLTFWDPLAYVGALVALTLVGLFANALPSLKVSKVDPLVALRSD